MTGPQRPEQDADQFWAWQDEQAGVVRARVCAARYDVHEDEACGSASMLLADRLQRPITLQHGAGSLIWSRPTAGGMAEVGGSVVLDEFGGRTAMTAPTCVRPSAQLRRIPRRRGGLAASRKATVHRTPEAPSTVVTPPSDSRTTSGT